MNGKILIPGYENKEFSPPAEAFISFFNRGSDDNSGEWHSIGIRKDGSSNILAVKECKSTMDLCMDLNKKGVIQAYDSVITEFQYEGKGQYGRKWLAPSGNLMASMVIPFLNDSDFPEVMIPLALGDSLCTLLNSFNIEAKIKWPNDIIVNNRKLAGILVEKHDDFYVTGLGINIVSCPESSEFDSSFSMDATSLFNEGIKSFNALILWDIIAAAIEEYFKKRLAKQSSSDLINSLIKKMAWFGEEIMVKESSGKVSNFVFSGLSEDGGIVLKRNQFQKIFYSCTIRPAYLE